MPLRVQHTWPGGPDSILGPSSQRSAGTRPLVREADLNNLQLLQVELGFGKRHQHSFESALAVYAVQHALVRPDLNGPFAGRDLDGDVELQLAWTEIKDEVPRGKPETVNAPEWPEANLAAAAQVRQGCAQPIDERRGAGGEVERLG